MEYPIKKGQRLIVDIVRAGDRGHGVAKVEGLTVLVDQALPGERVACVITETQPRYALARVERLQVSSPHRVKPPCPVYAQCGGCCMQFMDEQAQLTALSGQAEQLLRRVGGRQDFKMLPPLASDSPWRYRNKAVFRAGGTQDAPQLGFVGRGTHTLIPADDCLLQTEEACAAAQAVVFWMRHCRIAPYDEKACRGVLRHVCVRTNKKGETMVMLVTASDVLPEKDRLVAVLKEELSGLSSVVQNINSRTTQQILGPKNRLLYGQDHLEDELMGLTFRLSPLSFYQVNRVQTEKLYAQALDFAELTGTQIVVDAYCGAGTVGLSLARRARHVIGIEIVPEAVRDAQQNAALNGIHNARFIAGACELMLPQLVREELQPDVVMLDPPRRGCEEAVLRAAAQSGPERIVYISCNPATLARDVKRLETLGYRLCKARAVDMFSWTGEVECVALIQRVKP